VVVVRQQDGEKEVPKREKIHIPNNHKIDQKASK
jgi:hypothetical protein